MVSDRFQRLAVAWNVAEDPERINFITMVKIPSQVAIDQSGNVLSWGVQCHEDDANVRQLFKVWLDKTFIHSHDRTLLPQENPQRPNESEEWSYFYICSLIKHAIISIGENVCKGVDTANLGIQLQVHYILSTPTTWDENTIRIFSVIVTRAINDAHKSPEVQVYSASLKTLNFNITEPEAVANFVLNESPHLFIDGDIFLVLDVGGATADPYIAQIAKTHGHCICLPQDSRVSVPGVPRGFLDIGQKFQFEAFNRLTTARIPDPFGVSCRMRKGHRFRTLIRTYAGSTDPKESILIPIPGLEGAISNDTAGISHTKMKL